VFPVLLLQTSEFLVLGNVLGSKAKKIWNPYSHKWCDHRSTWSCIRTMTATSGNMEGGWTNKSFQVHQTSSVRLSASSRREKIGNGIQGL
jgi:hypothetical protein